jgi:hypothetical protein
MAGEENSEAMNSIEDSSGNKVGTEETPAARRARLRPSLTKPVGSPDPSVVDPATADPAQSAAPISAPMPGPLPASTLAAAAEAMLGSANQNIDLKNTAVFPDNPSIVNVQVRRIEPSAPAEMAKEILPLSSPPIPPGQSSGYQNDATISPKAQALIEQSFAGGIPAQVPGSQVIDILMSIDQTMASCATNIATLEKVAQEQSEALKALTETLEKQTFSEIALNLSGLTESLAAALEPMKAASELVPAIDQLVAAIEGSDSPITDSKITKEQLLTNLADQLSAGLIDPWTFKCAYMAVYPADHPADLLHRLVDLLGTQRLSGDLFRAAYEAVQAAEVPPMPVKMTKRRGSKSGAKADGEASANLVQSEDGEPMAVAYVNPGDFVERAAHERLVESQELMDGKLQELDNRYKEIEGVLQEREVELQKRSVELSQKDSENQQLKAQMKELQDQTKDLVADLQKQLTQTKTDKEEPAPPAKPVPGFFDVAAGQSTKLFDNAAPKSLFQQEGEQFASAAPGVDLRVSADFNKPQLQPQNQPAVDSTKGGAQQFGGGSAAANAMAANPIAPNPAAPNAMAPGPARPEPAPMPSPQMPQQIPGRPVTSSSAITTPMVTGPGSYGSGVRAQVFEVIVRQALAGAPWQDICHGPMQVNNISPEEVEAEVKRRQALLKK